MASLTFPNQFILVLSVLIAIGGKALASSSNGEGPDLVLTCPGALIDFDLKYEPGPLTKRPINGTYFGLTGSQNEKFLNGLIVTLSDGSFLVGVTDYVGTNGHRSIYDTWTRQLAKHNLERASGGLEPLTIASGIWSGEFAIRKVKGEIRNQLMSTTSGLFHQYESHTGTEINRVGLGVRVFEDYLPHFAGDGIPYYIWNRTNILNGSEPVHLDPDVNRHIVLEMRRLYREENIEAAIVNEILKLNKPVAELDLATLQGILVRLYATPVSDGDVKKVISGEEINRLMPKISKYEGDELVEYLRKEFSEAAEKTRVRARIRELEKHRKALLATGSDLTGPVLAELMELKKTQPPPPNFRHDINNVFTNVTNALKILELVPGNPDSIKILRRNLPSLILYFEKLLGSGVTADVKVQAHITEFIKGICRVFDEPAPVGHGLSLTEIIHLRGVIVDKMTRDTANHPLPVMDLPADETELQWSTRMLTLATKISNWANTMFRDPDEYIETFHFVPVKK